MADTAKRLGVIVWPPAVQDEGINAVLDNLQAAGVTAVSTSTYVAEPAEEGSATRREPPDDGGRGMDRVIERPLWGQKSLYLRTGPSFEHDRRRYEGMKYAPAAPNDLTDRHGSVISEFLSEARRRGMKTYLQMHVSHLPRLREGMDESARMADVPRLPSGNPPGERMVNFAALASPDVQAFFAAEVKDILTAYPQVDGLLLDRAEQSVYTFHDAFVDFGPHAQRLAGEMGFDFDAMKAAANAAFHVAGALTNERLAHVSSAGDVSYELALALRTLPALADLIAFRSATTTSYLGHLRRAANEVRPGVELVPITFPPPLSILTGADFHAYAAHADAVMIKLFTMHWPLIVTYWTQAICEMNSSLDSGLVARAVSLVFDFEDEPSASLDDYVYPPPDRPHRAGAESQLRKIRQATAEAGKKMPVLPSVHAYGPLADVERRFRIGWEGGKHGMWVNRYGYLSEGKLELLKRIALTD